MLNFETHGAAGRPALLLLHGFMSSRHQWLPNQAALAAHYHLVLVELWGHGDSPEPEDIGAYSVEEYIRQFEGIREQLGIDGWGLIGQSYGTGLVLNYALARPDVCTAVVVTNSRSAFGDVSRPRRRGGGERTAPGSPRDLPIHPINARRFPDAVKAALVKDADAMTMTAIGSSGRLSGQLNFNDRLGELSQPVVLINGKYEKGFQDDVARLRQRYPDLTVIDLEGGHSINIEDGEGFNAAVLEFFNQHLEGGADGR